MLSLLLDAVFPKRSLGGGTGNWVTPEERAQLRSFPIVETTEHLRAHGIHHLDRLVAGSNYRQCPLLKNAIWTFKFRRVPALGEELGKIMIGACHPEEAPPCRFETRSAPLRAPHHDMAEPSRRATCVLVPVPLHWTRRFWRGFNQSEILARIVSGHCRIPVAELLRRIRPTGFQSHRSRSERLTALRNAFEVRGKIPSHVILIDDVATTGATLDACAQSLKRAGAEYVEAWIIARG